MLRTIFNYQGESALITSCANNDLKFMKSTMTLSLIIVIHFLTIKIMLSEQYFSINNEQHHINSFKETTKISFSPSIKQSIDFLGLIHFIQSILNTQSINLKTLRF
jgi:hypothetical protein